MSDKIPCTECGKKILPATAQKTGGYCMPCGKLKNPSQLTENDQSFSAFLEDDFDFTENFISSFQEKNNRSPEFSELPAQVRSNPGASRMAKELLTFNEWKNEPDDIVQYSINKKSDETITSHYLEFIQSDTAITNLQTKFGGQPIWISEPQWPISHTSGEKLSFIGQIVLDENLFPYGECKVVYLFMNTNDDADETWNPDGGENAVIIQPGDNSIKSISDATGPIVEHAYDSEFDTDKLCEFSVKTIEHYELKNDDEELLSNNKIGGIPYWYQYEAAPYKNSVFIAQLNESIPVEVNFGSGKAYIFINTTGTEGKLLWQC